MCQLQDRLAGPVAQVRGIVWSGVCARLLALRDKERQSPLLPHVVFHSNINLWRAVHTHKPV